MDTQTIETYDIVAEEYERKTIDYWSRFPNSFLHAFLKSTDGPVLDVGSGPGRDALIFQYHNIPTTCLDASKEMVERCKKKGLSAVLSDMTTLPFPDNSFAGVWAYTSLLHLKEEEIAQALQEIHRVLEPQGVLGVGLIEGQGSEYKSSHKGAEASTRFYTYFTTETATNLLRMHEFAVTIHEPIVDTKANRTYLHFLCKKA